MGTCFSYHLRYLHMLFSHPFGTEKDTPYPGEHVQLCSTHHCNCNKHSCRDGDAQLAKGSCRLNGICGSIYSQPKQKGCIMQPFYAQSNKFLLVLYSYLFATVKVYRAQVQHWAHSKSFFRPYKMGIDGFSPIYDNALACTEFILHGKEICPLGYLLHTCPPFERRLLHNLLP